MRGIAVSLCIALALGCAGAPERPADPPQLSWARTIAAHADPAIVTDPALRQSLIDLRLPWHVRDVDSGIELMLIPPGSYTRGARDDDPHARDEERPAHTARVRQAFYLGRTEVTQDEWVRSMGAHDFEHPGEGHPAENITVPEIERFLARTGFDLPTEVEWEWAARGASDGPVGEIDAIDAWYAPHAEGRTHPVATRTPNGLGLHDLLGNVWELTRGDWTPSYDRWAARAPVDPASERSLWRSRYYQSFRGGSFYYGPEDVRPARRQRFSPGYGFDETGFRVRCDVDGPGLPDAED